MTHLLAPLDGSPLAETILPFVETLARRAEGRVTLLYVTEISDAVADHPSVDQIVRRDSRRAESYLDDQRRRLTAAGIDAAIAVCTGRPATEILRYAATARVDLIALSTHGRSGIQAWTHGSVAEEILHTTTIPLLLVRPNERWDTVPHDIAHIVVPLDGSFEAESALSVAEPFAIRGIPLALIRCVEPLHMPFAVDPHGLAYLGMEGLVGERMLEARTYLEGVAARLRQRGARVTTEVSVGAAAEGIASYARSLPGSMVVLASHSRPGWQRILLGSVARRLERQTATPLVVCPVPKSQGAKTAASRS